MLVYSAFIPYIPLKPDDEGNDVFDKTLKALKEIKYNLYSAKPQTIILISQDSNNLNATITLNYANDLDIDLSKLGDFNEYKKFNNDLSFIQLIKENYIDKDQFVQNIVDKKLSYPESIAMHQVVDKLDINLVTIKTGISDSSKYYSFGEELIELIEEANKRVAIIAVGNLSHCLTKSSPFGFKKESIDFDKIVLDSLKTKSTDNLLNFNEKIIKKAKECGLTPLLVLLGVLKNKSYNAKILSYEHPIGVGYMVSEFELD